MSVCHTHEWLCWTVVFFDVTNILSAGANKKAVMRHLTQPINCKMIFYLLGLHIRWMSELTERCSPTRALDGVSSLSFHSITTANISDSVEAIITVISISRRSISRISLALLAVLTSQCSHIAVVVVINSAHKLFPSSNWPRRSVHGRNGHVWPYDLHRWYRMMNMEREGVCAWVACDYWRLYV